jgi:leader peptidase (prepilin peptidase) / N-methyltransferase
MPMAWPVDGFCISLAIVSPAVGSFIGGASDRLRQNKALAWSRSRCEGCEAVLGVRDLVPLLSYCALGGRCRFCKSAIPARLFVIEALAVLITLVTQTIVDPQLQIIGTLFAWTLLFLAWLDYRLGRLPNFLTVPLFAAGIAVAALRNGDVLGHVLGAALGLSLLASIAFAYRCLRRREGLGFGDVKMFGAVGAWVGWQSLPVTLLLAALLALIFSAARRRVAADDALPFGPFISAAAWMVWMGPALEGRL